MSGLRVPRRSWPPYIWRRSRWKYCAGVVQLAHLHVVLGAQREEALDARAGVLRPLPFEAVRQQHHQAAGLAPLRSPQEMNWSIMICAPLAKSPNCASQIDQRQRIGHAVAELEAQHGVLAERAVEDVEARLVGRDVLQGHVAPAGLGIVERQVALAEGAAAGILAAEPHRRAFERQRAEGQRFAEGPIDGPALGDHVAAPLDEAAQLGMQMEVLGEVGDAADHAIEHLPG